MSPEPRVFYFGCQLGIQVGHYLFSSEETKYPPYTKIEGFPWEDWSLLDSYLCPNSTREGTAKFLQIKGWTILSVWDSSGDERPGSNSNFIVERIVDLETLSKLSKERFPTFWSRMMNKYKELSFPDGPTVKETKDAFNARRAKNRKIS